ncbi:MAG TPA: hypothetical protein VI818_05540, partial [Candidatus Thermoplasmatota archaeon]|nr:hypothetical protein [Candidatus Thermoplasmatota archaeon]
WMVLRCHTRWFVEPMADRPNTTLAARLAETLREAERIIDVQAQASSQSSEQTKQLISLGVAAMAAGGTLAIFGLASWGGDSGFLAAMGAGLMVNVAALYVLVNAYLGRHGHSNLQIGPDPNWLAAKANDPDWTLEQHYVVVIADYAGYFDSNVARLRFAVGRRYVGIYLLLAALAVYGTALLLVSGGRIL